MSVTNKITDILNIISDIRIEDPAAADILTEGVALSLGLMSAMIEKKDQPVDISEQLEMVSRVLNVSLKDLVAQAMQELSVPQDSNKEPDQATMDFILSDMDDYEKFLAKNKATESLDFLSKAI